MPTPSYDRIVALAIRLGRHECPPGWIRYPTWVTPPPDPMGMMAVAAELRGAALRILRGEVPMPSWLEEEESGEGSPDAPPSPSIPVGGAPGHRGSSRRYYRQETLHRLWNGECIWISKAEQPIRECRRTVDMPSQTAEPAPGWDIGETLEDGEREWERMVARRRAARMRGSPSRVRQASPPAARPAGDTVSGGTGPSRRVPAPAPAECPSREFFPHAPGTADPGRLEGKPSPAARPASGQPGSTPRPAAARRAAGVFVGDSGGGNTALAGTAGPSASRRTASPSGGGFETKPVSAEAALGPIRKTKNDAHWTVPDGLPRRMRPWPAAKRSRFPPFCRAERAPPPFSPGCRPPVRAGPGDPHPAAPPSIGRGSPPGNMFFDNCREVESAARLRPVRITATPCNGKKLPLRPRGTKGFAGAYGDGLPALSPGGPTR